MNRSSTETSDNKLVDPKSLCCDLKFYVQCSIWVIADSYSAKQMINVDLEQFAISGTLGPFSSSSTRAQIEQMLGASDGGDYPDFATYGNLSFDLAGSIGPPCRIQIAFPHRSHMTPANPNWQDWTPPTCFDDWPDKRFHWNLGRFKPGLSLNVAIKSLDGFNKLEMISTTNGQQILHNSKSRVDLVFDRDSKTGNVTLSHMVAHPKPITK